MKMTNQVTIDKLLEMRLSAMSDAFLIQLNDPQMQEVPFADRFGMIVDAEYTNRKNNSLKRLIKGASFGRVGKRRLTAFLRQVCATLSRNRAYTSRCTRLPRITPSYKTFFYESACGSFHITPSFYAAWQS